jgi:hypothetical protein
MPQFQRLVIKGPLAWLMHCGYRVLAVPSRERKVRVLVIRLTAEVFGWDIVSQARRSNFVSPSSQEARTRCRPNPSDGRQGRTCPAGRRGLGHLLRRLCLQSGQMAKPAPPDTTISCPVT